MARNHPFRAQPSAERHQKIHIFLRNRDASAKVISKAKYARTGLNGVDRVFDISPLVLLQGHLSLPWASYGPYLHLRFPSKSEQACDVCCIPTTHFVIVSCICEDMGLCRSAPLSFLVSHSENSLLSRLLAQPPRIT